VLVCPRRGKGLRLVRGELGDDLSPRLVEDVKGSPERGSCELIDGHQHLESPAVKLIFDYHCSSDCRSSRSMEIGDVWGKVRVL
jgi:hypothetical protein